jgi:WD40 repeat protein
MKSTISASNPSLATIQNPGAGGAMKPAQFIPSIGDPALKRSFKGHKDSITGIAFNPNLKQVVSSSLDGTLMVWNFKPTLRPYRFIGHKGPIYDLAVSPNG